VPIWCPPPLIPGADRPNVGRKLRIGHLSSTLARSSESLVGILPASSDCQLVCACIVVELYDVAA
jgi:hypothetical protein